MKTIMKSCALALLLGLSPLTLAQDLAPININTADAELLVELPGIGPAKADAIIQDREANGPFSDLDDLSRVSGIGDGTVNGLRDQAEY